jgi:hypothetical protein
MNRSAYIQKPARRILLLMVTSLLAGSVQAEWLWLGRNEDFRVYVDRQLVQKNGEFVQMWQLMDFTTAQWEDARTVVWSIKNLIEYDCRRPRSRTLVGEAYSEQMGAGRKVASDKLPDPPWEDITPGTTAEKIRQIACEGR